MVASVDGFIAKPDNSVSWFETEDRYDKGVTGENAAEFLKTIDCYVMGARTYEHALALSRSYGWAYGDTPTVVLTHRDLVVERPNIELYSGELGRLVNERLRPRFGNVWVVGGAALVKEFLQAGLADEVRMTVLPVMLGDGLLFFDRVGREQALHLKDVTAYKNGMVELWYEISRE
jgi:dihydrofolate reductase